MFQTISYTYKLLINYEKKRFIHKLIFNILVHSCINMWIVNLIHLLRLFKLMTLTRFECLLLRLRV